MNTHPTIPINPTDLASPASPASPAMQRYAAEIYRLQERRPFVSLAELAEHLDVSAQAVSRMVQRLKEAGFLVHKPYRGVRLTEAGERISLPAIRRHRLIEVFLVKVMGYDWSETHDVADVFEQGVNGVIEDRIDDLTGHPTRCPHGDPIPTREGVMARLDDMSLIQLASGQQGVISRVRTHDPARLRYLGSIGLVPGTRFSLRSCAPFNGPLRLTYAGHDEVLGYELASAIWVERVQDEARAAD